MRPYNPSKSDATKTCRAKFLETLLGRLSSSRRGAVAASTSPPRRRATPPRMQHSQELSRRRRECGLSMPDDRDRPPHVPPAKPNEGEGAVPKLTFDGEPATPGHAMAASHGQLHGFPRRQVKAAARGNA